MGKRSALERAMDWLSLHGDEPPPTMHRKTTGAKRRRPAPARHNRKCKVCRHPERAAIEQDFLRWRSPDRIAEDYGIADHSSVYRHAHATGLFDKRAATIRLALGPIIEQAMTVKVTADAIVRAIYVHAHLTDDGKWVEPVSNRQTAQVKHDANR
jgi:hypothetical protein